MSFLSDKQQVRKHFQGELAQLSAQEKWEQSLLICEQLELWWKNRGQPALWAFYPFRDEPDILPFLSLVFNAGNQVGFPRIEEDQMVFHTVGFMDGPWKVHRWGMKEPLVEAPRWEKNEGVILVPGLAFDHHGGRLGRGGGFYDKFLARLSPQITRVGLGFSCQESAALELEAHDQRLGGWISPQGYHPAI